jgi:hypothetical protein
MTELSVAPIASVILALVLAVNAYNKTKALAINANTTNHLLILIIALALFLIVAVIAVLFKPTSNGAKMFFSLVSVVALVVAVVVAWLIYVNNVGQPLATEALVIALVSSIPVLATLISRDTLTIKLDL